MSIQVMLVDDHKMLREGIKSLLEFDSDLEILSEASSAEECLDIVMEKKPDVILMDINLPGISGIQALKEVKRRSKKIKVLMLTVHNEVEYLIESLDAKADGYILKDSSSDELIKAIKTVYNEERYIQPDLIPALNARLIQNESDNEMIKDITKREMQMLGFIALGKTNAEIGVELNISDRTVKNHISNLFKKINVTDRTQAAVFAIRNNLIQM
ncbi:MAG: response regulator transcription factor [Lachnospiraceae bacterium]|nr:response regulator transcription factor [Lachnospiraceae bacterium]